MDKLHLLPDKPSFIWCFSPEMTPPHFAASADWHWAGPLPPQKAVCLLLASTPLYHCLLIWYNLTNTEPTLGC